jgi:hypothetical protein
MMAKRFTDTEKYKKRFIRNLPAAYKIFWDYLYHDCDHAGIWQVDFEVAQICVGKDAPITAEEALRLFNEEEERVIVLNGGGKWFIKTFVEFQYGVLNPLNRVHQSVLFELQKYKIKGLASPLEGAKEKEKDKDKERKGGVGEKQKWFEEIWAQYPNKLGKAKALSYFNATVQTEQDYQSCRKALERYKEHLRGNPWKHPQNGKTWFNSWKEWVDFVEVKSQKDEANEQFNRLLGKS